MNSFSYARTKSRVKYWEIIPDKLSKAGWSWGCVSAIDSNGQTIWIVDAHHGDGKRYVLRADEKLTAFMELQAAIHRQPASSQSADGAGYPDAQLTRPARRAAPRATA